MTKTELPTCVRETSEIENISLDNVLFQEQFNRINICKSQGRDNITAKEMKMVGDEFQTTIGMISRMSFQSKTYLSQWKVGKVKTVHKKRKKDNCGNYRPLSMLSIPSKITESVICDELDKHLETVLLDNQWGYRKGKSSETMLLHVSETWKRNIGNGKVVGVILINFHKAFDTVNHNILHQKMKSCGLKGTLKKLSYR